VSILNLPHNKSVLNAPASGHDAPYYARMDKDRRVYLKGQDVSKLAKEIVEHNLRYHVFARLFKSEYGVGVMAFRNIPPNTTVFDTTIGPCVSYYPITLSKENVSTLFHDDPGVGSAMTEYLGDFYLSSEKKSLRLPINALGPNAMDISFFLNHSDTPNLNIEYIDGCDMSVYKTNKAVNAGDELTIDYRKFSLPENVLHEFMPFLKQGAKKRSAST
jgi:hypothetical protein